MTSNAEISHKFTEAQNAHDVAGIEAVLAEDSRFESARLPVVADGRANVAKAIVNWLDTHTDYELKTVRERPRAATFFGHLPAAFGEPVRGRDVLHVDADHGLPQPA
jgi:hypothetical protein